MKEYKTYLFDWDGCIANTLEIWIKSWIDGFKEKGLDRRAEDIVPLLGSWNIGSTLGLKDDIEFNKTVTLIAEQRLSQVDLNLNAKSVLHTLKGLGKRLALVSASQKYIIEMGLKFNEIEDIFDSLVTAENILAHKPDPESLNLALKRLDVTYKNAVIVGDSHKDILAGQAARVDTILYANELNQQIHKYNNIEKLKPDFIISDLIEILPRYLQRKF